MQINPTEVTNVRVSLKKNLYRLTARERFVLRSYYGIGRNRITLSEIGEQIGGVTRERARQIREIALRKIGM